MLGDAGGMDNTSRNEIVGLSDSGLVLQIDGREVLAPWSAILEVGVVLALIDRTSDRRIPVFVLGVMVGDDKRVFIVGNSEPMWEPLASTLPETLPGMSPFEIWGVELAASGKASLYNRTDVQ